MSRDKYNTEQATLILNAVKAQGGNFDIKQIEESLKDQVGPATVYRQIKKLCQEGKVKKQLINGIKFYCYVGDCEHEKHFNLLCKNCGKLQHVDCDCLDKFCDKISKNHDFEVDSNQIIITGICKECKDDQ